MAVSRQQISAVSVSQASSSEWRWVLVVGAILLVVVSAPLLYAHWVDATEGGKVFMGLLSNPIDGATYFSKIQLGQEGQWRTIFRHTPDATQGAYITLLYNGLGQLSRYMGVSPQIAYHAGRVLASLLMFLAIYQFASVIWRRERTRRVFFIITVLGSGFGWLLLLLGLQSADAIQTPDLVIPEAFALYSAATNVQFPVAFALLALSAGVIVVVFRPGFRSDPTIHNGGLTLILSATGLGLVAPHGLVPFTGAVGLLMVIDWVRQRKVILYQFRWFMLLVLPALPIGGYYIAEIRYNPEVAAWMQQNVNLAPMPWHFLAGFGLPLLLALPGIWRAIRRFEPDGDQFMLLWLVLMLVMVYFPTSAQRRFAIGMMLPVAYFTTRALMDFWLDDRAETYRNRFLAGVYGISAIGNGFLLVLWFVASVSTADPRFYLDADYDAAFQWLNTEVEHGTVVMASESVSLWLPGEAGMRVVYGHPFETLNADARKAEVAAWYGAADVDAAVCERVVRQHGVAYVLVGPIERERNGDNPACAAGLEEVRQFGDVLVYRP